MSDTHLRVAREIVEKSQITPDLIWFDLGGTWITVSEQNMSLIDIVLENYPLEVQASIVHDYDIELQVENGVEAAQSILNSADEYLKEYRSATASGLIEAMALHCITEIILTRLVPSPGEAGVSS